MIADRDTVRSLLRHLTEQDLPLRLSVVDAGGESAQPLHSMLTGDISWPYPPAATHGTLPTTIEDVAAALLPVDVPTDRLLAFLVNTCTRDLAYGVETGPVRTAEATTMLARLIDLLGPEARWRSNCDLSYVSQWSETGKPSPLSWNPLTHYTFDRAVIGTGGGITVTFLAVAED
ncbi:hypothetical protein [Kutzneria chonburiensis]|uniref:Uncharacterized protein n=1 Tax=Kutzneria chonburiensis TaxID=1483604 RepID=A0ABV6MTS7_9PSEU|nr:hypothetical protein [Kutzneria chonburiensis]